MTAPVVRFVDLRLGADGPAVRAAIDRVLDRAWFVLGPEVEAFEQAFARASGAAHAVGVGNGTDAITLLLRAAGVGRGDEVVVPALTSPFTALAVLAAGAEPVFADVDPERLTLDPAACAAVIGPRTRAVVPVHLYGQAADVPALAALAAARGLALVEDCCQAHLATCGGVPVGTAGVGGAFSFYPTKNLGALGDGGALITGDADVARMARSLRDGGRETRDRHATPGVNSRLDELQAAVLAARLPGLAAATARRRAVAAIYRTTIVSSVRVVVPPEFDAGHVYHLFPVLCDDRDGLARALAAAGIESLAHYPVSLPAQPALADARGGPCPVAHAAAGRVLSLPVGPGMSDDDARRVAAAVNAFAGGRD
jgi:dTDP-3-amino-3,4,6-trideoxy-alpha-D-glucose transaminase